MADQIPLTISYTGDAERALVLNDASLVPDLSFAPEIDFTDATMKAAIRRAASRMLVMTPAIDAFVDSLATDQLRILYANHFELMATAIDMLWMLYRIPSDAEAAIRSALGSIQGVLDEAAISIELDGVEEGADGSIEITLSLNGAPAATPLVDNHVYGIPLRPGMEPYEQRLPSDGEFSVSVFDDLDSATFATGPFTVSVSDWVPSPAAILIDGEGIVSAAGGGGSASDQRILLAADPVTWGVHDGSSLALGANPVEWRMPSGLMLTVDGWRDVGTADAVPVRFLTAPRDGVDSG